MNFIPQLITDLILIKPTIHKDSRGYFAETFRKDLFEDMVGYKVDFIQDNESQSIKGVLRGLHYQLPPYAQSKLVRVLEGRVLDVAVDIRKSSPTFGQHIALELTEKNNYQLFVEMFALTTLINRSMILKLLHLMYLVLQKLPNLFLATR